MEKDERTPHGDTNLLPSELNVPYGAAVTAPEAPETYLSDADAAENSLFVSRLTKLALPIALQSFLSAAVSCADVLVLSTVNASALSAVSLAGQIVFVLTLFYMGISTGLTILGAQYWGKRDTVTIEKLLALTLKLSMGVSFVFFAAMLLFPVALMHLFSPDETVVAYGVPYLRIVSVSCLAMGVSQMLLSTMKCMEQPRISALIGTGCLIANILLNMLAVFVLFPNNPELCIVGVAGATTLSRLGEVLFSFLWMRRKSGLHAAKALRKRTEPWLMKDFRSYTLKVQANFLIWGGALTAMSAIMGHVGTEMVSAYAVANSAKNLSIAACNGFAAGGGILLGTQMGAGRLALAHHTGRKLFGGSLLLGAGAGVVVLLLRPLCLRLAQLPPTASLLLDQMLVVCALYCIGESFNATLVSGVFCAGGDTRFGLLCDTIALWGVILPLGYLCAFVWKLPPLTVFIVLSLNEVIKMPFVALHFRKGKWLKNLTRKTTEG